MSEVPFGYVVFCKWKYKWKWDKQEWQESETDWNIHFNRKIYINEACAKEAVQNFMREKWLYSDFEFKIYPVFIDKNVRLGAPSPSA